MSILDFKHKNVQHHVPRVFVPNKRFQYNNWWFLLLKKKNGVLLKYTNFWCVLGMSDLSPLSGISGLLFHSPFLSPLSFFCLVLMLFWSCHFSANGPFSSFLQKILIFSKRQAFSYGSCWAARRWQYVLCTACCHMALVFDTMHLCNVKKKFWPFSYMFLRNLVSIH